MTLPTILYSIDDEMRSVLLRTLTSISREMAIPFQIQLNTNDLEEVVEEIRSQQTVALFVLCVESIRQDRELLALRLGRYAMKTNRDHYVVYVIRDREDLERLLPLCTRSAGILICPPEEKAITQIFTPLLEDYRRIYGRETSEDGQWLNLKADGKMYRIRRGDVCLVQAVNKMIEFHTLKQTIQIYGSMSGAEKMLDDSFIRCHRSYLINRNMIQYIDFREMSIHMMDGSLVPLARSFKDGLQHHLLAEQA